MNTQSRRWEILPGTQQEYRWSESKGAYVFRDGRAVPQGLTSRINPPAPHFIPGAPSSSRRSAVDVDATASALDRLKISNRVDSLQPQSPYVPPQTATAGFSDEAYRYAPVQAPTTPSGKSTKAVTQHNQHPVTYRVVVTQGYRECTATDNKTGVATSWKVSQQTSNDQGSGGQDPFRSIKHIGDTIGNEESHHKGYAKRKKPRVDFKIGTVFETLIVSPPADVYTTGSYWTTNVVSNVTRMCRFVVIREEVILQQDEGAMGFRALMITTYGGQGVGKPGVVKKDHSVIHTGRDPPQKLQSEIPQPLSDGTPVMGMLPHDIRVVQDDRQTRLDPMSRLNYRSLHSFHYGVKVKIFGRVHQDSCNALLYQFRLSWPAAPLSIQDIRSVFQNMVVQAAHLDVPEPRPLTLQLEQLFMHNRAAMDQWADRVRASWRLYRRQQEAANADDEGDDER